jgi:hypothetical protein
MEKLTLEFTTQLKDQLVKKNIIETLPILENLEVRAKGYHNFFGDIAVPFGTDDYFADFMLAKYDGKPFFTIKHTTFASYTKYNINNPIKGLVADESDYNNLSDQLNISDKSSWIGGLTYLKLEGVDNRFLQKLSMELTLFFVQYVLFNNKPKNIIVTANIRANFHTFLQKEGFIQTDHPHVIHPELGNNAAAIMSINHTNQALLDNYYKYNINELTTKKAA